MKRIRTGCFCTKSTPNTALLSMPRKVRSPQRTRLTCNVARSSARSICQVPSRLRSCMGLERGGRGGGVGV
ncbi:hypothetical protein CERSUDRAFT_89736, partial [Gelatoporia subvermispora B]